MTMKRLQGSSASARTRLKRTRPPHNARIRQFDNISDLVRELGREPKRVTLNGQEVEMCWSERMIRVTVDRALNGNRRDIALLLRLMTAHSRISGRGPKIQYRVPAVMRDV